MTGGALVGHVRMLPREGADELPMAIDAQPPLVHSLQAHSVLGPVGIVAIDTQHPAFWNRVMRNVGKGHADPVMATHALIVNVSPFEFLTGTLVQLVAIRTGNLRPGVSAEGPVLHAGHGVGAVAFETEHGKGRCR